MFENMLEYQPCADCPQKGICFLHRELLCNYSPEVQNVIIHVPSVGFKYNDVDKVWHANYQVIQDYLFNYYNASGSIIVCNRLNGLLEDAQRERDKKEIQNLFKYLLDVAAKATEKRNIELSIMFDGIGMVLITDYYEAVNKVLSIMEKGMKLYQENKICQRYNP